MIGEHAAPGAYPLALDFVEAADAHGGEIPIGSASGTLTVKRANGDGEAFNAATGGDASGCGVGQSASPAWMAFGLVALLLGGRRAGRAACPVRNDGTR